MSEFDSGSGRKGFVRDVMRRISSPATPGGSGSEGSDPGADPGHPRSYQDEVEDLQDTIRLFGTDSSEFRRRLDRLLAEFESLRRRYKLTRDQVSEAERQNERLVGVFQEAKQPV